MMSQKAPNTKKETVISAAVSEFLVVNKYLYFVVLAADRSVMTMFFAVEFFKSWNTRWKFNDVAG